MRLIEAIMTKQEFLKLREIAFRERQKRELRTLLIGAGSLIVFVPAVLALGHYIVDHPESLMRAVQTGWRYFMGAIGTGLLLLAFVAARLKLSHGGVPCPNCHSPLQGYGAKLALISGNCCRCGRPIFREAK